MKQVPEIKLHLACGPNIVENWTNIDILKAENILRHDLREKLPFNDGTVGAIFHEHFIEHLIKSDAETFLNDCYRVLKSGGAMRIGWPDLSKLLSAYFLKKKDYREYVLPALEYHRFDGFWDEIMSDCLFDWEHRYAYTSRHLIRVLQKTGFREVQVKKAGVSAYAIALDFRRDPATTYLEMLK